MIARMRSAIGWIRRRLGNSEANPARAGRRPARVPSIFDTLERREVPSSGTFSPFVTLPGAVTTAGEAAQVVLHLSAGQVTSSGSANVLVGFYAEPAPGSTAIPQITGVDGPSGPLSRVYLPKRGGMSPSKSLFIGYLDASTIAAQDFTVDVSDPGKQAGNFVVEAFLPGDANGDGTVDQADLALVHAAYGTGLGQASYDPAADFNADGHVGCIDLHLTELNQGAHISYGTTTPISAASVTPTPTPIVATTPIATTPIATTSATTTTSVATSGSTASAASGAAFSSGAAFASAASAASATTTTATSATSATTLPPEITVPMAIPVVPVVPYLAYVYPQANGTAIIAPTPTGWTATATAPVLYYGQPVVQAPSYSQVSAASPVLSYGQPVAQSAAIASSSTPIPAYSPGGQASSQAAAMARTS